mmetsp:Transcript_92514/g.261328  ORF Transcript_92514/g.261328 Transcript_92514/m.261328 type:complete len:287 (-) Transcript_92514:300-1160(-)
MPLPNVTRPTACQSVRGSAPRFEKPGWDPWLHQASLNACTRRSRRLRVPMPLRRPRRTRRLASRGHTAEKRVTPRTILRRRRSIRRTPCRHCRRPQHPCLRATSCATTSRRPRHRRAQAPWPALSPRERRGPSLFTRRPMEYSPAPSHPAPQKRGRLRSSSRAIAILRDAVGTRHNRRKGTRRKCFGASQRSRWPSKTFRVLEKCSHLRTTNVSRLRISIGGHPAKAQQAALLAAFTIWTPYLGLQSTGSEARASPSGCIQPTGGIAVRVGAGRRSCSFPFGRCCH